jgi:phospholipid transport system substrate-binding protein
MLSDTSVNAFSTTTPGFRRRSLLGIVVITAASLCQPAFADTAAADAAVIIDRLNEALLAAMKTGQRTAFSRRFDALAPAVDQAFDLPAVLAVSVGSSWSGLPPDQQSRLMEVFRRYTVASYVANFDHYDNQNFTVLPDTRRLDTGRVVVQSRITAISGETTRLDYVMQWTPSGWKVTDVLAAGSISRVAVQRSDFRRLLSQGGSEALLFSLQRKTAELSSGALA